MTYQEAYRRGYERLEAAGITDARTDTWILMEAVSGMSRALYLAERDRPMPPEMEARFREMTEKRTRRIPVQYLTGEQEFMGYSFRVTPDVLIPRQDTEVLVETAEKALKPGMRVLDMCTGSGCIAVSLALRHPEIQVQASDISGKALAVAQENARRLVAEVTFVQSDMFAEILGPFDVIVSNPPYIPTEVIETLQEEVRLHEPKGALDGSGDGLFFYRILAEKGGRYLKPGGRMFLEIGCEQSRDVEALLRENGFEEIQTGKDLAGLDRVVTGVVK